MRAPRGSKGISSNDRLHPAIATAIAGGGLLLLTLTVLMAFLLAELHDSGEHIASQDAKITRLYQAGKPLADETQRTIEAVPPLLEQARPLVRRLRPLALEARRVVADLAPSAPALEAALRRLPPLSAAATRLASTAVPFFEGVDPLTVSSTLTVVRDLSTELAAGGRLVGLIDQSRSLLSEVAARGLPQKAARSSHRLRDALSILRKTLAVQRRALRVQRRTKAIQSQALVHIESIDRKTGGTVPAASGHDERSP